jgi:transposase-like protein
MLEAWTDTKGGRNARKEAHTGQIITKLRQAEVAMSTGNTVVEAVRQIGVTEQTVYRWRNEYGGLSIDQAKRLKQIEAENARLKRALADLTLDNQILKEAAEGNF